MRLARFTQCWKTQSRSSLSCFCLAFYTCKWDSMCTSMSRAEIDYLPFLKPHLQLVQHFLTKKALRFSGSSALDKAVCL